MEPAEIADEMFQAGHMSDNEHDVVTCSIRRYERLENLLILFSKNEKLYVHLKEVLQSSGYSAILHTLQMNQPFHLETCKLFNSRLFMYLRIRSWNFISKLYLLYLLDTMPFVAESALLIQQNFSYLQEELPRPELMLKIIGKTFDVFDHLDIEGCPNNMRKTSKLLKIILRKGEYPCRNLLHKITQDLNRKDMISRMKEKSSQLKIRGTKFNFKSNLYFFNENL